MAKRTTNYNAKGIENLPDDNPVTYKIKTVQGNDNYIGVAGKGNVKNRLRDHLPGGKDDVPGSRVEIEQQSSIKNAREKETNMIKRNQPKYNKKGK